MEGTMTEKIIKTFEEAVEKISAEEYLTLLSEEPHLKTFKTKKHGLTSYIIGISNIAAEVITSHYKEFVKFGETNIWQSNYLTVAVIYGIEPEDYYKFKELYQKIRKEIKKGE